MARVKDERRGRLATLQDLLAGGGKVLVDQAQALRDGVQSRIVDVGRGLEGQVGGLVGGVEKQLVTRIDDLLSGLAVTLRRDAERLRERVRALENRLADVPKEGFRELILPLQTVANGAAERASVALARLEETGVRLQNVERRMSDIARDHTRGTPGAPGASAEVPGAPPLTIGRED